MATTYIDPLCDRLIAPSAATPRSEYRGKTYYFCCDLCKQLFDREPQKHIAEKNEQTAKNQKALIESTSKESKNG